jgi:hypothetical protein
MGEPASEDGITLRELSERWGRPEIKVWVWLCNHSPYCGPLPPSDKRLSWRIIEELERRYDDR